MSPAPSCSTIHYALPACLQELAGNQLPTDLPALLPRLAPSVLAGPSGSGAGTLTAAERELLPSAQPPLDWSLKTTARFSSPTPFAICDDAAEACSQEGSWL